jgi:hypothetical protein
MLVYIPYMDPMGDGFYWFLEPFWSQDIAGASPGRCREALPVTCSTTRWCIGDSVREVDHGWPKNQRRFLRGFSPKFRKSSCPIENAVFPGGNPHEKSGDTQKMHIISHAQNGENSWTFCWKGICHVCESQNGEGQWWKLNANVLTMPNSLNWRYWRSYCIWVLSVDLDLVPLFVKS